MFFYLLSFLLAVFVRDVCVSGAVVLFLLIALMVHNMVGVPGAWHGVGFWYLVWCMFPVFGVACDSGI